MNKAIIIGKLGRDPESKETKGGMTIVSLSVATSERRKEGDTWKEHTEWHRVKVFGKVAENCERFLSKGSGVAIEGRIQTQKWTDKDGVERYTTEIIADNVEFVGGSKSEASEEPREKATKSKSGGGSAKHSAPNDDADVPF